MAARSPQVGVPIFPIPGVPIPGSITAPIPGTGSGLFPHIPNPLSALSESEHLFAKLLDPHTYVRMGEVAVGTILLAAGLFAMLNKGGRVERGATTIVRTGSSLTPAGKASSAASAGSKVAKSTPPLTRK